MKIKWMVLSLIFIVFSCTKQFSSLVIEKENVDANNSIYKPGTVFIYDYEIIKEGTLLKLKTNEGRFTRANFEFAPPTSADLSVNTIHLIVRPVTDQERTNKNQTEIAYLQAPVFSSISSTGIVENASNVWIHPIRKGFFSALETAPYPFVQLPLMAGKRWGDQLEIGEVWANELWGTWEGNLLLNYSYEIIGQELLDTEIGAIDCYKISSTAASDLGTTKLTSYFSEQHGFVRLEYELMNDLKVNMWLIDFMTGKEFNDLETFIQTKNYLRN